MHITISGNLGSGKSTVAKLFAERNKYKYFSTGALQRKLAEELGITTLELNLLSVNDPKYDKMIDAETAKIYNENKNSNIIYDSRMAWHFVPKAVKIFLSVDINTAAERIYNAGRGNVESYESVNKARQDLKTRADEEQKRYKKKYNVDIFDMKNYEFVIDTTNLTPDAVCEKIEKLIKIR